MGFDYIRSLANDFNGTLVPDQLVLEINTEANITIECKNVINVNSDDVIITFVSELLTEEEATLDTVISTHQPRTDVPGATYDAIVDVNGNGEFVSIAEAFANGHVSVFVRNGVYMETSNIVMPDYGSITGESGGNVIIHFLGMNNGIVADGSGGTKETAGTISVTNLNSTVVGTGTTFTNLTPGNFILVGTNYYKIASITDDTSLELADTYRGVTMSGLSYIGQPMYTGILLIKLIITGAATSGIYLRACWHFTLKSVAIKQNYPNLSLINCGDSALIHVLIEYGVGDGGIIIENGVSISFDTADVYNNLGHGIYITGYAESLIFKSCETSNNGGCGFYVGGNNCIDLDITTSVIKANTSDGVYLGANTQNCHITQLTSRNNGGNGLLVLGNEHNITSNFCNDNTVNGILINGDDSIVNGNTCRRNAVSGIKIETGSTDNIVVNNNVKSNTGTNLDDQGTTSTKADNMGA